MIREASTLNQTLCIRPSLQINTVPTTTTHCSQPCVERLMPWQPFTLLHTPVHLTYLTHPSLRHKWCSGLFVIHYGSRP